MRDEWINVPPVLPARFTTSSVNTWTFSELSGGTARIRDGGPGRKTYFNGKSFLSSAPDDPGERNGELVSTQKNTFARGYAGDERECPPVCREDTRGRGGERLFMGSVTKEVMRRAACSGLALRAKAVMADPARVEKEMVAAI